MGASARFRTIARALADTARRAGWAVGERLRPPRPWDGRHHPALLRFEPWRGESDGTFAHDFLGVRTDPAFRPQFRPDPPGPVTPAYPVPHPAYFEWVFVLESVIEDSRCRRFTMMELGAGFGPWLVAAARAMQMMSGPPVRLVGVEMSPIHFRYLRRHFRNNGLDPDAHTLIHAAVSERDGEALYVPEGDPSRAYGQRIRRCLPERTAAAVSASGETGLGKDPAQPSRTVRVPCVSVRTLLADLDRVDLLHCDLQGEERRALGAAWDEVERKVRRLILGTHSRAIHRDLRRRLRSSGWNTVYDFRCRRRERTQFGDVRFLDGLLAAVNPRI